MCIRDSIGTIVVRGRVTAASGEPVAGATVTAAHPSGDVIDWETSDGNGWYSLALPGAGRYRLRICAAGWRDLEDDVLFASVGDPTVSTLAVAGG